MAILSLDSSTTKFYIGCYLSEVAPSDISDYFLPVVNEQGRTSDNYEHLIETSNVEELLAPPEEFRILPLQVQSGSCEWESDSSQAEIDYGNDPEFLDSLFYGFYIGTIGRGRDPEPFQIAVSDFYLVSLEVC